MSEFKEFQVNDLVVCTDEGLEAKYLAVKKITGFIDNWGLVLNDGEHWVEKKRFRHAEPEEIAAGHRIDNCKVIEMDDLENKSGKWAWEIQAELQAKVEQLKGQLERAGYTDKGGELMKPPLGKPPSFDLLDELKNSISEMAHKYRVEAHELSRIRDFEKSQMCSHFANELENLNKGGA